MCGSLEPIGIVPSDPHTCFAAKPKRDMQATETCQPQRSQSQWIDGIELLRAIAVALVAVSHGFDLINNWNNSVSEFLTYCFSTFLKPGWWGVRIFFAISG